MFKKEPLFPGLNKAPQPQYLTILYSEYSFHLNSDPVKHQKPMIISKFLNQGYPENICLRLM